MQHEGKSDLSAPQMQQGMDEPVMLPCIKVRSDDDDDGYAVHHASQQRRRRDED